MCLFDSIFLNVNFSIHFFVFVYLNFLEVLFFLQLYVFIFSIPKNIQLHIVLTKNVNRCNIMLLVFEPVYFYST